MSLVNTGGQSGFPGDIYHQMILGFGFKSYASEGDSMQGLACFQSDFHTQDLEERSPATMNQGFFLSFFLRKA